MSKRYFDNPDLTKENLECIVDENLWKSRLKELIDRIIVNQKKSKRDLDGGLYVGAGGVAYMLWYVSTILPELGQLEAAKTLADIQLKNCQPLTATQSLGFLLGDTGVLALSAAIAKSVKDPLLEQHVSSIGFPPAILLFIVIYSWVEIRFSHGRIGEGYFETGLLTFLCVCTALVLCVQ